MLPSAVLNIWEIRQCGLDKSLLGPIFSPSLDGTGPPQWLEDGSSEQGCWQMLCQGRGRWRGRPAGLIKEGTRSLCESEVGVRPAAQALIQSWKYFNHVHPSLSVFLTGRPDSWSLYLIFLAVCPWCCSAVYLLGPP